MRTAISRTSINIRSRNGSFLEKIKIRVEIEEDYNTFIPKCLFLFSINVYKLVPN